MASNIIEHGTLAPVLPTIQEKIVDLREDPKSGLMCFRVEVVGEFFQEKDLASVITISFPPDGQLPKITTHLE